jgi:hypothetical protein
LGATKVLRRGSTLVLTVVALAPVALLAGCNGPTVVDQAERIGNYKIDFSMDPQTLKPPQLVTVNYAISEASTNKPVKSFDPIYGALIHNVIISRDLTVFKHSYATQSQLDQFSMLTQFPQTGEYYSYTIFKPTGGDLQVLRGTIQSGDAGQAPQPVVDAERAKLAYGSRFELLTGPNPIRAGQPSQLAVFVTERGSPVTILWPFLDAPGYLWTIGQDGNDFGVETGAAQGRPLGADNAGGTAVAAPTLMPDVQSAVASRTAQPVATLFPAQQTALVSVVETPAAVLPGMGFGPTVAFTHTFPKAGLYKVWAEMRYRGQDITVDWVLNVAP